MDTNVTIEKIVNSDNNLNSPPTDTTSTIPALPWSEVMHILTPFRNYEPGYLALSTLPVSLTTLISEDISLEIQGYRERTYMPTTLARESWNVPSLH